MNALQQFLQAASNEAAGTISGPVDLIGMGLRKLGVPVPRNALMSSEWMKQNGLMQDVPQSGASLAGQTFGLLSPVAAAAKAPQIAGGLLKAGENLAAPSTQGAMGQRGSLIADWRWRPAKDVASDLSIDSVPKYITDNYGKFMVEQAAKAKANRLGGRDLLKAYGITRSSVNRGAREISDDLAVGSAVRPEGYFSEWLLSPAGRDYLDGAMRGQVDGAAINDIVKRFDSFGMAPTLGKDLEWAAQNVPGINGSVNAAVNGSPQAWRDFAQELPGIGPSKSGFIASLLGRGDMPTFDARQIALHTGAPAKEASKYIRRGGGVGGDQAVDRLARRQAGLGLSLPNEMAPHYQHLTHHSVWDKVGGSTTTHEDLIRAMQQGRADPALLGLLGLGVGGAAYYGSNNP